MPDIVDIAVGAGSFKTLVTAVQAAGLVDVLRSPGPFTVFAPTDEAFAKLPPGTVQTLVQNIPQLSRILTYHVVPGRLMQADLQGVTSLTS
ncbi:MAG TPA: fasciclin domain-containing protein, partial [Thermosynechococcaceae cyanobacterium]